ncbi:MAG: UDP-N-acetylmuramate--L-alanine ligase [Pirellulales bacterium]|nr:UDP-N-acetylmuramate--L-alanine ligase [Pirellulales bacterium]
MRPANSPTVLDEPAKLVHFVGIGGSGMRAMASVFHQLGWAISGSDARRATLCELTPLAAAIELGHQASHLPKGAQLLIYSDAVPPDNPERAYAEQLAIPTFSYAQMLGHLSRQQQTIAVAGTHGKSTVTSMIAEILASAAFDPTVVCGAEPRNRSDDPTCNAAIGRFGGRHGRGPLAVVEACEYRENFLHLSPNVAVVLNVEPDHFDYYPTRSQLIAAVERFIARTPENGLVVASADCPVAKSLAGASGRYVTSFGFARDADWRATNLEHTRGRYRFDLVRSAKKLARVALSVPGRHNVANALAAAAVARHQGVSAQHIVQGLAAFRGLKRRLDARATMGEITWIDDYAHHPTEVAATLHTLREMFPRRPICCVFQPHQVSRLTALLDEFARSLHNADRIAVAEVFRAREGPAQRGEATAFDLADRLRADGLDVFDEHDPAAIVERLADELQAGDVLATLGAGDLGTYFHGFHERLRRDCAAA